MTNLTTDRLILRAPEEHDLRAITELVGDLDVSRMLARVPHPYRLEDARAWYRRITMAGSQDWQIFAVTLNDAVAGMIGCRDNRGEQSIGYWLGKPYWRRGIMSEACAAAVAWFFDHQDADALHSGVFEDNPASLRIQEKLGFEVVGSAVEACLATGVRRLELKTRLSRAAHLARRDRA